VLSRLGWLNVAVVAAVTDAVAALVEVEVVDVSDAGAELSKLTSKAGSVVVPLSRQRLSSDSIVVRMLSANRLLAIFFPNTRLW